MKKQLSQAYDTLTKAETISVDTHKHTHTHKHTKTQFKTHAVMYCTKIEKKCWGILYA